jgi:hypothetical protein
MTSPEGIKSGYLEDMQLRLQAVRHLHCSTVVVLGSGARLSFRQSAPLNSPRATSTYDLGTLCCHRDIMLTHHTSLQHPCQVQTKEVDLQPINIVCCQQSMWCSLFPGPLFPLLILLHLVSITSQVCRTSEAKIFDQ